MWEDPGLPSPCQLFPAGEGGYACFLPASCRPDVRKIHQIPKLRLIQSGTRKSAEGLTLCFGLRVPWRMRGFKVLFRIAGERREQLKVSLLTSRFRNCGSSACAVPVAELPYGVPGAGEVKNPGVSAPREGRFFAADLPQGGEVFCRLTLSGAELGVEDVELWVSGFESPARAPEEGLIRFGRELCLPLPYPEGFPVNLRLW